ncbi:flagellin [uncultured Marinobacter sp.]|uniref:flagellin N-terminal helical domain-containing protein n=1 Tax=uncultured Marinobacter sp. TaxID=187379 RepID=UPI0032B20601|tara:strand:- start:7632 stop:9011 length:1380 start_codon:yes stop_codon:yes gene_type:complete
MALGINTNIASLTAQNNLSKSQSLSDQALQRLSSGLRINSAKDDAAGLAISTRFSAQISGLAVAQRNANDGISYAQTAEGALGEITDALTRIRDLAVQSANDTNSASDRQALNQEVGALIAEINRIAGATQFNGQNILDGTLSDITFQVGANRGQVIAVDGVDARGSQLGARVSTSGSINGTNLAAAVSANDLMIQGQSIDISGAASTQDIVNAINDKQGSTGVSASLAGSVTTADLAGNLAVGTGSDGVMIINGVQIAIANNGSDGVALDQTIANINALSEQTGVVASSTGSDLILSNSTGDTIEVGGADYNSGTGEKFYAGIELSGEVSDSDFSVSGTFTVESGNNLGASQKNQTLNDVSVLTRDDASQAIQTVDFAIDQINSLRAELGAVQSRFESTISNLASTSENLSAANSRILDADFASETANLAKAQVLQQAGISVLAQANARPQQVLSLLQ